MVVGVALRRPSMQIDVLRREEHVWTVEETISIQIGSRGAGGKCGKSAKVDILPHGAGAKATASSRSPVITDDVVIGNLGWRVPARQIAGWNCRAISIGTDTKYIELQAA